MLAMVFAISVNAAPSMADPDKNRFEKSNQYKEKMKHESSNKYKNKHRDDGSRDSASKERHHGEKPEKAKNATRERLERAAEMRKRSSSR